MKPENEKDYKSLCMSFMDAFLEVKEYLESGDCENALKCLNIHAREIDDVYLARTDTGELPIRQYETEEPYKTMYLFLFNSITDALQLMYNRKFDTAATRLMVAQRKAERIFLDGEKSYT